MKTQFQINNLQKFVEEDDYENGCDPSTTQIYYVDVHFSAESAEQVITKCANWLGVESDGIEKNACEEDGRVDFSLMEDESSTPPSKRQISAWKQGREKLYNVIYTGYVVEVTPVKL